MDYVELDRTIMRHLPLPIIDELFAAYSDAYERASDEYFDLLEREAEQREAEELERSWYAYLATDEAYQEYLLEIEEGRY